MKMNVSMDFIKPLSGTVKKYSALLPSVVITLVAVIVLFLVMMMGGKVKGKMEKSAQTARSVKSLVRDVPSKYEPQQVKGYMDKFEAEVKQIRESQIQSSRRNLVTYDYVVFPKPEDKSSQVFVEFGDRYRQAIEELIKGINALDAPSDSEIRARTGGARTPSIRTRREDVDVQNPMVSALCLTRAQEISVYANPSAFKWYGFWDDYEYSGDDQALEDCWDAQVAFWIYEDIVDTIAKLNGSSAKVLSAPVKRLLGVSFSGPVEVETSGRGRGRASRGSLAIRDIPNYVAPRLPSRFISPSPTARVGDEDIDVVHFAVSVLLSHRNAMPFMKELCSEKPHTFYPEFKPQGDPVEGRHNQITILQSDIRMIDKTAPDHELYRYGKGAVARLDLICEYQFDRQGYDAIKPDPVKKRLDQFEETTQDGQPGGDPGMMDMF